MEHVLARSEHYTILHEYETAVLDCPCGTRVAVGDFYGDPEAAVIDYNEKWVVIVGCGIILYWLREPFMPYQYDRTASQWWEAHRSPPDEWWIEAVYQVSDNTVRFVVDPLAPAAGVYELDVESQSVVRVIPREEDA